MNPSCDKMGLIKLNGPIRVSFGFKFLLAILELKSNFKKFPRLTSLVPNDFNSSSISPLPLWTTNGFNKRFMIDL